MNFNMIWPGLALLQWGQTGASPLLPSSQAHEAMRDLAHVETMLGHALTRWGSAEVNVSDEGRTWRMQSEFCRAFEHASAVTAEHSRRKARSLVVHDGTMPNDPMPAGLGSVSATCGAAKSPSPEWALALAYMTKGNKAVTEALEPLCAAQLSARDCLDLTLTPEVRRAKLAALPAYVREHMTQLVYLFVLLQRFTGTTEFGAVQQATSLLPRGLDLPLSDDEWLWYCQAKDIEAHYDLARVCENLHGALNCLRAICYRHHQPTSTVLDAVKQGRFDVLDRRYALEAALLYQRLQPISAVPNADLAPTQILRHFWAALSQEVSDALMGEKLIPSTNATVQTTEIVWSGGALRHAMGLRAEDIVQRFTNVTDGMPIDEVRRVVQNRLSILCEDAHYPIGTPFQSLATTILRLGPYYGISVENFSNVTQLLAGFYDLERAWDASPAFPVEPRWFAAHHLALSSGECPADTVSGDASSDKSDANHAVLNAYLDERLLAYTTMPKFMPHNLASTVAEKKSIENFYQTLPDHPVVQAKAREVLRLAHLALTPGLVNRTAQYIVYHRDEEKEPEGDDYFRRMLESFLVTAPLHYVSDALAEHEWGKVLSLIPFVMPAYELEEGIRHRDLARFEHGAAAFGLDALMFWLGGGVERRLAASLAEAVDAARIPAHEFASIELMRGMQLPLDDAMTDAMPLLRETQTVRDPFRITRAFPRARDGRDIAPDEAVSEVKTFTLRVEESESAGGVEAPPPAGADVSPVTSPMHTVISRNLAAIPTRPTVVDVTALITSLQRENTDGLARTLIKQFQFCTMPCGTPKVGVFSLMAKSRDADGWLSIMRRALDRSPTLMHLADLAVCTGRQTVYLEVKPGVVPIFIPETSTIFLPPTSEVRLREYVTPTGSLPFQKERAVIHEFIHAVSGLPDNVGGTPLLQRGGVVYFVDRVLFEMGENVPERIMYSRARTESIPNGGLRPYAPIEEARNEALLRMIEEDRHLDTVWAPFTDLTGESGVRGQTHILGTSLVHRHTVEEASKLYRFLVQNRDIRRGNSVTFPSNAHHRFVITHDVPLEGPERVVALMDRVLNLSDFLVSTMGKFRHQSQAFQVLFDFWCAQALEGRWKFEFIDAATSRADPAAVPWRVDAPQRRIEISLDPYFYYLSPKGPLAISQGRRLAGAMARVIQNPDALPLSEDPASQRGIHVLLENLFLQSPADKVRINAEWSRDPSTLLAQTTKARRAAAVEDQWLEAQGIKFEL